MIKFCKCGREILVRVHDMGKERIELYVDGKEGPTQGYPVIHCPQCGQFLRPNGLSSQPKQEQANG